MNVGRVLTAALVAGVLATAGCSGGPRPAPTPTQSPIASCVSDAEQSTGGLLLPVAGGRHADAVIVGAGATGIVLANQLGADLCTGKSRYGDPMSRHGYRVLMFNYSGADPGRDVLAAVAAFRSRGVQKVFLIGASKGGTSALYAAAHAQPRVAGVVSLSGPMDIDGVDAVAAVRTLTVPALFVAAEGDGSFAAAALQLHAVCASRDKKLDLEPGGAHGWELLDDKVQGLIDGFLKGH
jgi:pimeloyl-ACP methyl ester carboxylesterase